MDNQKQHPDDGPLAPPKGIWMERATLVAILLCCAVAISPNVADPDLWGHVQYGRDALAEGLPATATYTYTAEGYRWINHENIAELLLAIGADHLGPRGMLFAKCLLGVLVIWSIMHHANALRVGLITVCTISLLTSINLSYHWSMRPQLCTYICYTLLLFLLSWCFQGWEGRWRLPWFANKQSRSDAIETLNYSSRRMKFLWLAVPLFFFWANSHGGFVAGVCIFIAYMGLRSIEALACKGRNGWGLVLRFSLMSVCALLATLINPYGPNLHAWLLKALTMPRPEITEWHGPDLWSSLSVPLWLIMSMWGLSIVFTQRSRDFTHLTILALTLWQSLEHQRHIPFFALAFAFWMPIHVESMAERFRLSRGGVAFGRDLPTPMRWMFGIAVFGCYLLLMWKLKHRLDDMPVDRKEFPVAAMQYIADQELEGRMVVTYNWAQYVISAFGPKAPGEKGILVGFDGRFRTCYPQEVVDMHFDFILGNDIPQWRQRSKNSPPPDGGRVLEFGKPDLVLINRFQPHAEMVMNQHHDTWTLLYQDKMSQVWGRTSRYGDQQSPDFIPPGERIVSNARHTGSVTWPALPVRGRNAAKLAGG